MRDHGGNLDAARARFGGAAEDWIDLSTGINRRPYPLPPLPPRVWTDLPAAGARAALIAAARKAYRTEAPLLPTAGAQAAIQMLPRILPPGRARVLSPTYNEHSACLRAAGWQVEEVASPEELTGADLAVIVNPNNPDGRVFSPEEMLGIAGKVGFLVADESFGDARPELSLAPEAGRPGLIVLRSFGKFYGLAGLRLGFAIGPEAEIAAMDRMAGPWPVSGAALEIGRVALSDSAWQEATATRLRGEAGTLDRIAQGAGWTCAGWTCAGGTELFRLYRTANAQAAQERLARAHIWSRIFPWSPDLLRLGLPGAPAEWARLAAALG